MQDNIITLPGLTESDAWEDPLLFDSFPTQDIPTTYLPGIVGEFATALANTTETPHALSVMTLLGVLSTLFSRRITVSPKAGWHEPINLYLLIALPPAHHKSLVMKQCLAPLVDWERQETQRCQAQITRQQAERQTQEKIIERLRTQAAKCTDPSRQKQFIQQVTDRVMQLPSPPTLPVLFVNDVTPESLAQLVHDQAGRLAIFSDEGGILENLAGLYNRGVANTDILLKGIDGGSVRVYRKDKHYHVNPYLTIFLAVQPTILHNMALKKAYQGNGTLERFLYVQPPSTLGYRTHNTSPLSHHIKTDYHQWVTHWLDHYKQASPQNPITLTLSPEAYQHWHDFQQQIETALRPQGKFATCPGWGGKLSGQTLRLAGLLHQATQETPDNSTTCIGEITMKNAISLARQLAKQAVNAFEWMGNTDTTLQDAKGVCEWILSQQQTTFKQSEVTKALRSRAYGRSTRLTKALACLHERHIISQPIKLPTRKPTKVYYVNPKLIKTTS